MAFAVFAMALGVPTLQVMAEEQATDREFSMPPVSVDIDWGLLKELRDANLLKGGERSQDEVTFGNMVVAAQPALSSQGSITQSSSFVFDGAGPLGGGFSQTGFTEDGIQSSVWLMNSAGEAGLLTSRIARTPNGEIELVVDYRDLTPNERRVRDAHAVLTLEQGRFVGGDDVGKFESAIQHLTAGLSLPATVDPAGGQNGRGVGPAVGVMIVVVVVVAAICIALIIWSPWSCQRDNLDRDRLDMRLAGGLEEVMAWNVLLRFTA